MPSCVVTWCRQPKQRSKKETGITYHSFPKNEICRLKWIAAVRLERREDEWLPCKFSRVCSIHFDNEDIYSSQKGNRMLKKTAVPICTMVRNNNLYHQERPLKEIFDHENIESPNQMICSEEGLPMTAEKKTSTKKHINERHADTHTENIGNNLQMYFSQFHVDVDGDLETCENQPPTESVEEIRKRTKTSNFLDDVNFPPIKKNKNQRFETKEGNEMDKRVLCDTPTNIPSSDIDSVLDTPRKYQLKQQLRKKDLLAEKRLKKIKKLQRNNNRLIKRNITLKDVVESLKSKGFEDSTMHAALSGFPHDLVVTLKQKSSKKGRSIIKFTPAIKKFALTVNYYSPAAYKYIRSQLLSCLPHPTTISKWYQSIDGKPGFSAESFRALKAKLSQSDKNLACLVVDEMAIRQQKIFNGQDIDGLVTYGPPEEIATQVYVLMLVSLNDCFKLPIGYFFINGLAAEQRCNFIIMALTKCHEVGAEVVSLTFDGCASNFATAKLLGCDFEKDMKTYFDHPITKKPVVVILDPCHMVKLVRNVLEAKKIIIDKDGQKVQWKHLENLNYVQENISLHFGNKITTKHLQFRNNIMNVKLATQTLSNSVATALKLCSNELNLPEFDNANATVNFIEIINNLFDVLNTRNLNGYDFKRPITLETKNQYFEYLDRCFEYLQQLKINVQNKKTRKANGKKVLEIVDTEKLLIHTQSKTGFLGLMICISSFKILFTELVEKRMLVDFILPYKFSQDHLELFFGVIRNHGRCNNNPNARQFMGIYKKTLVNLELRSKFTGNCIPLEEIPILNCSSMINETTPGFRHKLRDTEKKSIFNMEMENCSVMSEKLDVDRLLPETVEQIIGYIAGFVARKIQEKLECSACIALLRSEDKLYFHKLISLKDNGGLVYPSVVIYKICLSCETLLRQIFKITRNEKNLTRVSNLRVLTSQCFSKITEKSDIVNPVRQSHGSDNGCHDILIIRAVVEEFLRIRLHYIAKNESMLSSNRQKVNKLVIFRGT